MDGATTGGGGGGPAPFLLKTYDMVDDRSTDEIVSWSSTRNSFVVWNPPEFARLLLPTYFKHNNFSSFIRQLNTYGFRKIDPERWEFANEDFVQDQKHLLKNIHRRKPIHSHSNPQGSAVDPERAAFEEEIDKLSREKTALEANISSFKQQEPAAKLQLEELTQRISSMEQRQENLVSFLEKVVQNPDFVEHLARKLESIDLSAYNKKRRLPQAEDSQSAPEDSLVDNQSFSRPESGNIFHQDFSNKLRLELSPAVSDINLVSHSTQSSNEEGESPQKRVSEGCTKDVHTRSSGPVYTPETLDLSDTGTSFTFNMDSTLSRKGGSCDSPRLHSLQQCLTSSEEGEGHISCQLNLTLSSSPLQAHKSQYSARISQEIGKSSDGTEIDFGVPQKNQSHSNDNKILSSLHDAPTNNPGPAAPPARVNDVFWEQFLTERPGASDNEEASSTFRANPHEISRNPSNTEHLTL